MLFPITIYEPSLWWIALVPVVVMVRLAMVTVHRCSPCGVIPSVECGINGDFELSLRAQGQFPLIIPSLDHTMSGE
jgi:hypothetical protein